MCRFSLILKTRHEPVHAPFYQKRRNLFILWAKSRKIAADPVSGLTFQFSAANRFVPHWFNCRELHLSTTSHQYSSFPNLFFYLTYIQNINWCYHSPMLWNFKNHLIPCVVLVYVTLPRFFYNMYFFAMVLYVFIIFSKTIKITTLSLIFC